MAALVKCPRCGGGLGRVTTTVRDATGMGSDVTGRVVFFTCPKVKCQQILGVAWHPDEIAAWVAETLGRS